jgi:hypothetical protein
MKTYFTSLVLSVVAACTSSHPNSPGSGSSVPTGSSDPKILRQASGCSLPQGMFPTNTNATVALMTGTWALCSGPSLLGHADEAGIQLNADGSFWLLVDDNGRLTPKQVFGYEGTWDVVDQGQVDWHLFPDQGDGGNATLEDNPRRFAMYARYNDDLSVYAIVDSAPM